MTDASINFDLLARDRASATFQKFGSNADKTSGKVKSLGKSFDMFGKAAKVGIVAATAAFAAAGVGIIKTGSDYVSSLNKIQTLNSASTAQMKRVAHELEGNSASYAKMGMTVGDAASGVVELTKAGMKLRPAMKSIQATMVLAKAGEIGVADAASLVSNTLNVFKMKASDAAKVANIMANAANVSSADVSDLQQALAMAANVAAGSGASFKQTAAMLAELSNAGMQGSDAGTSLKTMLLALQAPTSTAAKNLKAIGVSAFDSAGKAKAIRDVLGQLDVKFRGMTDEKRARALKNIFGTDAFRAARVIFGNGAAALDKYTKAVGQAGAAQRLANSSSKGLAGTFAMAKAEVTSLAQQIYRKFSPALDARLRPVVQWLGEQMPKVVPALEKTGEAFGKAGRGAREMAAALSKHLDFSGMDSNQIGRTIGDALLAGLQRLGALAGKITQTLGSLFAKVDWVGLGITIGKQAPALLLGLAAGLLQFDMGSLFRGIAAHWQVILLAALTVAFAPAKFSGVIERILTKIPFAGKFLAAMVRWTNELGGKVKSFGSDLLKTFWRGFTGAPIPGVAFVVKVMRAVTGLPARIAQFWADLGLKLGVWALDAAEAAGRGMRSGIGKMVRFAASIPKKIVSAVGNLASLLFSAGQDIIRGLLNGVSSMAGALTSKMRGIATSALNAAKGALGIHSPSKKFHEVGRNVMQGLLLGLQSKWMPVKDFMQKVTDRMKAAGDNLKSLMDTRNQFAAGFSSFSSSIFGRDPGQDANGNALPETVAGIKAFATAQRVQAQQLQRNVQRLVGLGLSKSLLEQMQANPSGIAQINALAAHASRGDIAYLNAQDKATQAADTGAGMSAANAIYLPQIKQQAKDYAEMTKVVRDLHNWIKAHHDVKELEATLKGSDILLSVRREQKRQTGKSTV